MDEHAASPEALSRSARRSIEAVLDRVEDRLRDAPDGLHRLGDPASSGALAASGLPPAARILWERWDGLDLACSEAVILPLEEQGRATEEALEDGRIVAGDRVIGERGRDLLVFSADPFAEGGDVVLVEEDGSRAPHSSTVERLALALLGEIAVLYDDEGEFREELYGEDGELVPALERRLLRRHLDLDPDAPLARFRLAQSLRRAGQARAALAELGQLLRRAPDFAWAHHERGRVSLLLGDRSGAQRAFGKAAELAVSEAIGAPADPALEAYFLAWQALASDGDERRRCAAQALERIPELAAAQEASVRAAIEDGDGARAREQLELGLAVVPTHLGLLSLRGAVEEMSEETAIEVVEEAAPVKRADKPKAASGGAGDRPAAKGKRPGGQGQRQRGGGQRAGRGGGRRTTGSGSRK
ncbi:MAG: hypothetical protein KC486_35300 [Myxococcales bacterium]|nr:hypothetical protein [Myxococcales bacterium]